MRRQKSKDKPPASTAKKAAAKPRGNLARVLSTPKAASGKALRTSAGESRVDLRAHGIKASPEGIERMVAAAIEELPKTLYPSDPSHDLTEPEREALIRGGLDLTPRDLGEEDPLARTAADYVALLHTSRSVAETAKTLGVNESRIRQRLNSKPPTLYGFKLDGEWRIPAFLFEADRLVPGVAEVASSLDTEIHPVAFFRWFTMRDPDLVGAEGKSLSPRLWLLSGHSPEVVAGLASEL